MSDYTDTAEKLARHILSLIPRNPGIMKTTNPWDLFKIKGFKVGKLGPSAFQASWALNEAKRLYNNQKGARNG